MGRGGGERGGAACGEVVKGAVRREGEEGRRAVALWQNDRKMVVALGQKKARFTVR